MTIKRLMVSLTICTFFILISATSLIASSLSALLDSGVSFGNCEIYASGNVQRDWIGKTGVVRAKNDAIKSAVFDPATINTVFGSLQSEYDQKGFISQAVLTKSRTDLANALALKPDKSLANIFLLGVTLGQLEIWGQTKEGSSDLARQAFDQAGNYARLSTKFIRLEAIFDTLTDKSGDTFEQRVLAARVTLHEQLVEKDGQAVGFRAGAYKVRLLVDGNDILIGYAPRQPSTLRDWLQARSLVLDDGTRKLAIVSIDGDLIYKHNLVRIKTKVEQVTGITNILLVATHDHSGPEFSVFDADIDKPEYRNEKKREEQIVTSIITAAGSLAPAEIGVGWGEAHEGFNRVVRTLDNGIERSRTIDPASHCREDKAAYLSASFLDPIDNELGVMRIRNAESKETISTLINFAMHAVVFGPSSRFISADYPGQMEAITDYDLGGVSLFLQGAAGDTVPWCGILNEKDGSDMILQIGYSLGTKVLGVSQRIQAYSRPNTILSQQQSVDIWDAFKPAYHPRIGQTAELNVLSFGPNLAIATFPGEFFAELGLKLKRNSPFANTMFVGYTNHAIGYVPPVRDCNTGGYGTVPSKGPDGLSNGPTYVKCGTGEELIDNSLQMLKSLKNLQ